MDRLKKRSDFLRAARGHKQVRRALVLQAWHHQIENHEQSVSENQANYTSVPRTSVSGATRVGFTVTKKVGNAVVRNRVRRRLKEAVRLFEKSAVKDGEEPPILPNTDYVVVGRLSALTMSFAEIQQDLASAFDKIGTQIKRRSGKLNKKAENPEPDHSPIDQNPLKEQGNKPTDIA